jgi:CRP-like cAMP-binding protein
MADTLASALASSPFAGLPSRSRASLLDHAALARFARREKIVEQGAAAPAFALIHQGRVKLERRRDGRVFSIGHRGPGELLGETNILNGGGATETATVVDEARALVVPMAAFRKLLANDGDLRAAMTDALLAQQRADEARLESLLLLGVEARVVELLLSSLARWGRPHPDGEIIDAPFTHADIAVLVGSTRETVTLLLGRLRRAQLIAFDRRRVVVRRREDLARQALADGGLVKAPS